MKATRAWIKYDEEYGEWQFSPTRPEYWHRGWREIVYFEIATDD